MDLMSFKVHHEDDLGDLENKVSRFGFPVQRIGRGESLGQGESIRFSTPSGHLMELVHDVEKLGTSRPRSGAEGSGPEPGFRNRIAPPRMDHMLVTAEEVGESTRFYMDVLGFRITEQLLDGNGHQLGTWLERSHSPHDLAIVHGPNGGLHHFAFWLDDWDDVRDAADILAYNGIQLDVGPTRHGITRGSTIYFFDPLGTRNEVFTGGYRPDPDFPTLTWTEDNIGRAIFYYEGELNDRFMRVHT
jgi:catechol 2,3-dioxygenase